MFKSIITSVVLSVVASTAAANFTHFGTQTENTAGTIIVTNCVANSALQADLETAAEYVVKFIDGDIFNNGTRALIQDCVDSVESSEIDSAVEASKDLAIEAIYELVEELRFDGSLGLGTIDTNPHLNAELNTVARRLVDYAIYVIENDRVLPHFDTEKTITRYTNESAWYVKVQQSRVPTQLSGFDAFLDFLNNFGNLTGKGHSASDFINNVYSHNWSLGAMVNLATLNNIDKGE